MKTLILYLMLSASALAGGAKDVLIKPAECDEVIESFRADLAHMRDELVPLTLIFLNEHPECDCLILMQASMFADDKERANIELHLRESYGHNKRLHRRLLLCFVKKNILAPELIPIIHKFPPVVSPPVITPI